MWGYSQSQCEENAKLENVAAHVSFRAGDAAKLSFVDETFDGAVSNFVFHEVRSQPDKLALFQEMLLDSQKDARVQLRQVEFRTQGRDHPILPAAPETQYLKCGIYQVFH